jgi:hypothetical protein
VITVTRRTRHVLTVSVDRLGRVRCGACAVYQPCERVELQRRCAEYARCDLCGGDGHTVEAVEEEIQIEHVTCKIF